MSPPFFELPETRYKDVDPQTRFRAQALANINSLPRTQAAMVSELPLSGDSLDHDFVIEGRPPIAPGDEPSEEDRAWFFKLFSLRGMSEGVERMCFFTFLQKSDDTFEGDS